MPHLWSTLRVGTRTETEQVTTWVQRAYPKKVFIDTQRDRESPSEAPAFAALQDALSSTGQWNELTISSLPPEDLASGLGFQSARPMSVLRALHVVAGCVYSPSFMHLLELVPTEAPLSELGLHLSFATTHFLQPHWFPVLQNLTVLIVNGRDIHEPFGLLPALTRLHTFEADRLPLPWYELNANLPLLCTLHRLQIRASSVQWMAGREFPCLEDCAILLPHHWGAVQEHEVQLPSCSKFTYHGYPMTTVQYFRVPQMRAMELKSHDCNKQRVYQQICPLFRVDGGISKLTTLHITLQCSEQAFIKVLKYLDHLQELILSTARRSPSWKTFLESLVAKTSRDDWPDWLLPDSHREWERWCLRSSRTWHVNILPHLQYLGVQCPKGFSQSECLDNSPLLRLIGWTRAHLTPPLEHLKVWEGRETTNDTVVDYISTGYLKRHPGILSDEYDTMVIRGMITQCLVIHNATTPLLQLRSTVLFTRLQDLAVFTTSDHEIPMLPYLEQITKLVVQGGTIPAYSLNLDLPLVHTLQWLELVSASFSWMLGRTFKALRTFNICGSQDELEALSKHEGLQVGLPSCTSLQLRDISVNHLHSLSCPNIQTLEWWQFAIVKAAPKSLHDFLYNCSGLQNLRLLFPQHLGVDYLIQFVCCDAREQGAWRDIKRVEVKVWVTASSGNDFFNQITGDQQRYEKWWKEFTVTMEDFPPWVIVRASM